MPTEPLAGMREALADPDDVALGRALQAVAAGDDPDVVAAQPQVLVEVADVLGHAAGERVDVRRDEPDLHASVLARLAAADSATRASRSNTAALPAARVAEVAAGAVAQDLAPEVWPARRGRTCAAGCRTSRAGRWCRGRCRGWVVPPRATARAGPPPSGPGTSCSPAPIASQRVGVAVADPREAVLVGEADDARCHGRPSVVGLNASSASGR